VAAPVDEAWRLLNDVPTVVPCMPGAELVEAVADDAWKAALQVKLGPIALRFAADVTRTERDDEAHRAVLAVKAREAKGRGSAEATITSTVTEQDGSTQVRLVTDLALRGAVAQYGRGVVADVSSRLTEQFAACLEQKLAAGAAPEAEPAAPPPISGLRLVFGALWRSLTRRR
jgi:carbon monoxide dehydrogenase subunit G